MAPTPGTAPRAAVRDALRAALVRGRRRGPLDLQLGAPQRFTDGTGGLDLELQPLYYRSDESPQGLVPCILLRPNAATPPPPPPPQAVRARSTPQQGPANGLRPAVILMHSSFNSKEVMMPEMATYARAGYVAAAIDARHHGQRAGPPAASATAGAPSSGGSGGGNLANGAAGGEKGAEYQAAVIAAWRGETEDKPFLLDTAWDVTRLLDLLEVLPGVDASRIGMTGISLGGMITWLVAAADERVTAAAPAIGVQNWGWALENGAWRARLDSIPLLGPAAAADMGKAEPDAEVAAALWHRLLPGMLECWDTPASLPCIAPRPLRIITGELDPRCPLDGVTRAHAAAGAAYMEAGAAPGALQLAVFEGVGHQYTPDMAAAAAKFFAEWL